jgi:hypothetical protein
MHFEASFPARIRMNARAQANYYCVRTTVLSAFFLAAVGVVRATEEEPWALRSPEATRSATIDSGFVIVDGQYESPPYVLERRGTELFINDRSIPTNWPTSRGRRWGGGPRGGPMGIGQGPRNTEFDSVSRRFDRFEEQLRADGLLAICGDEQERLLLPHESALVLDVLISDSSPEDKVASFAEAPFVRWLDSAQWVQIVENYQPDSKFVERARRVTDRYRDQWAENEAVHNRVRWYEFLSTDAAKYGVTVSAMALAVIAIGNLLLYRPEGEGTWSEVSNAPLARKNVVRNVVLLSSLGVFDLILTLAAQQAGTLLELNPLGSQFISSPFALAAFKLTSLTIVCLILLRLRSFRGAQIASWWMCMICTVLMFRWVTFNSLFFS